MNSVSIIGAGRLGATLGYALTKKGYPVKALSCQHASSAEESRRIIGQGAASTDNALAAQPGRIVILSVPDDDIVSTASELSATDINWEEKTVFHCSGLLPAAVLSPLKQRGAATASVHPVQTFPKKARDAGVFRGIYFGLEGDEKAVRTAQQIAQALGSEYVRLDAKEKPLFHTACSIASNLLVALLSMASAQFKQAGFSEELSLKIVLPLVQRTLQNVKKLGVSSALTGPLIRGDKKTLVAHLKSLENFPHYDDAYKSLARLVLQIAEKDKSLPQAKLKELKGLLEDR